VFNGRCDGTTLEIWGVIEGQAVINGVGLTAVRFSLLPAALGDFTVKAMNEASLLRSYVTSHP
jgi:mannose-6-phosphate isomerase